jgi:hypothetical protein
MARFRKPCFGVSETHPMLAVWVFPCSTSWHAPVAQLDRARDYESRGQRFESFRARQIATIQNKTANYGCADPLPLIFDAECKTDNVRKLIFFARMRGGDRQ